MKVTSDVLELRFDALETAFTFSLHFQLDTVPNPRSTIHYFSFFWRNEKLAKEATMYKQLRIEQSVSIQGGGRAMVTTIPSALSSEMNQKYALRWWVNDQNKPLSMTKLEKPHFRGLKAQWKKNDERDEPRLRVKLARLEERLWAQNSNFQGRKIHQFLAFEKKNVRKGFT